MRRDLFSEAIVSRLDQECKRYAWYCVTEYHMRVMMQPVEY